MKRFGFVSIAITAVVSLTLYLSGCKQEQGERCQVEADCADGLVCAQATQTCQETTGGGIDALPPPDAVPDAPVVVIDAPPDAVPDAP